MAELKTKINDGDVEAFLNDIADEKKRQDCFAVLKLLKKITKAEPKMWGASIIGFGSYRYKYESGREGDWFLAGFAPRKQNITFYFMSGFTKYNELLAKLGKHKTGKSCLHINKLEDVDLSVLQEMIEKSVDAVQEGKIKL
jgi:hypothetical protein